MFTHVYKISVVILSALEEKQSIFQVLAFCAFSFFPVEML